MARLDTRKHEYIMEHNGEGERLIRKTRHNRVVNQASWAGLRPGMRVLDLGCGAGLTTSILAEIVGPEGAAVGVDISEKRIADAREKYPSASFEQRDIYGSLEGMGEFDFIWIRFFLEYHRSSSAEIIARLVPLLTSGGILCVGELDHHSMNHYPIDEKMERTLKGLSEFLQQHADWDPYAGRKLYTHLFDAGLEDIDLRLEAHHLLFGEMESLQESDWLAKLNIAASGSGYPFDEYQGGFDEFLETARTLLTDPRRFTYTPIILCRGVRPAVQ